MGGEVVSSRPTRCMPNKKIVYDSDFGSLFSCSHLFHIILDLNYSTSAFFPQAEREGYIAIIMPRPADWLKVKGSLLGLEEYKKLREC